MGKTPSKLSKRGRMQGEGVLLSRGGCFKKKNEHERQGKANPILKKPGMDGKGRKREGACGGGKSRRWEGEQAFLGGKIFRARGRKEMLCERLRILKGGR